MIILNIPVFTMCLAGLFLAGYIVGKKKNKENK